MEIYTNKKGCYGCTACAQTCPVGAITMEPDEEGFLYAHINQELCVGCGRCTEVCPQTEAGNGPEFHPEPRFYIAHNNDEDVVKRSASGGAFTALSNVILNQGGAIYGVVLDRELAAVHSRAETAEERDRMCGSKYVQSRMGDIYPRVKADAEAGRPVLFTGTPCQAAGLRAYLGKDYSNLYICDVVCHSVSSPLMWKEYLHLLESEQKGTVTRVNFRDKTEGWQRASTFKGFRYAVDNGPLLKDDRFYRLFFGKKTIARPSCSVCRYARVPRISDITIADYWGVERFAPQWADYYGVSFIMTSTEKGEALLRSSRDQLRYEQRDPAEQISENHRLRGPMGIPEEERAAFWKDYRDHGFAFALEKMKG